MADLSSLKDLASAEGQAPVHVRKVDSLGRSYATGKRKNAVARVWVKAGSGKIIVNGKDFTAYFARPVLQMILQQRSSLPLARASSTSSLPLLAAVSPVRPALCATVCRRPSPTSSRACVRSSRRVAS